MGWLTDLTHLTGQYAPNAGQQGIDLTNPTSGYLTQAAPGIDPMTGKAFPTGGASSTPASTAATGSQMPLYGGGGLSMPAAAPASGGGGGSGSAFADMMGGGDDMGAAISSINKNLASANLAQKLTTSQNAASSASQAQYQKLLASVAATQNAVNSNLTQMGQTGEANIARQQAIDTGKTEQDAVARGLGNTTIRNQLLNGVTRNANDARTQLAEQLAQQRIAAQMQMGQMNGDAILSMQNQGPSNDYLQLLMQLASNGSGK